MVQCSGCDSWQHLHCLGYVGEKDPRIPEEHFCNTCVLDTGDVNTLKAIQELASQRRALFFACQIGIRSKADMSNLLGMREETTTSRYFTNACFNPGCDKQTGSDIHTMIVHGKYVEAAINSHKSGYRLTGKALWVPVQDRAKLREMLEIYFNPMTAVGSHYEMQPNEPQIARDAAEVNVDSLLALRTDLPEPVNKRFKSAERTPTPSSEHLASQTAMLMTNSSQSNTPVPQTLKRKAGTDNVEALGSATKKSFTTPSTKQRMFSGLKSLMVIDAGGDSSPPFWQNSARKTQH